MKKPLCTAVLFFALLGFAGCAANGGQAEVPPVAAVAEPVASADDDEAGAEIMGQEAESAEAVVYAPPFFLTLGGANIQLGANIDDIINAIGEPIAIFETPSCAFDGTDIVFRFPGVQIHTIPLGDANYVHTIALVDDTVSTNGGIFIGSGFDELLGAYGNDYIQEFSMYTFTRGHTSVSFFVDGGIIAAITYELDIDMFFGD